MSGNRRDQLMEFGETHITMCHSNCSSAFSSVCNHCVISRHKSFLTAEMSKQQAGKFLIWTLQNHARPLALISGFDYFMFCFRFMYFIVNFLHCTN